MTLRLSNFTSVLPTYLAKQEELLEWMAAAHARCDLAHYETILQKLLKVGVGSDKIQWRRMQLSDFSHRRFDEMEIYRLGSDCPLEGVDLGARTRYFSREVDALFEQFYLGGTPLPEHLIHVTCTGYAAPSGAQKLVSRRKTPTTVTHAYHMGCYAALAALRITGNFSSTHIAHTELCSLHMNPLLHGTEQLVVHSLFADGFIKYAVHRGEREEPHFEQLALFEEILPDTETYMSWQSESWGMRLGISREVPNAIARALPSFLEKLGKRGGITTAQLQREALFAIHPGGPKIIAQVAQVLELSPWQIAHSQEVLRTRGNMSSATLPHIWEKMLGDATIAKKMAIVSLAFGPGLTISGAIFKKG